MSFLGLDCDLYHVSSYQLHGSPFVAFPMAGSLVLATLVRGLLPQGQCVGIAFICLVVGKGEWVQVWGAYQLTLYNMKGKAPCVGNGSHGLYLL